MKISLLSFIFLPSKFLFNNIYSFKVVLIRDSNAPWSYPRFHQGVMEDESDMEFTTITTSSQSELVYLYNANEKDHVGGGDGKKNSLFELIKDLLKKYLPGQHAHKVKLYNATEKDLGKYWQKMRIWLRKEKDYRKIMGNLVKDYIDGVEKVMKANVKRLQNIFRSYLNRRTTDSTWDEVIVNMVQIKKVHLIDSDSWHRSSSSGDPDEDDYMGYEDFLKKVKADGFKGKYWGNEMDLEIYIRKLVKSQAGK